MYVKPNESSIIKELHEDEAELHNAEEELREEKKSIHTAFIIIAVFIVITTAGAYYFIRSVETKIAQNASRTTTNAGQPAMPPVSTSVTPPATVTPSSTSGSTVRTKTETAVKDYYINIGFGTNQSSDWSDVFGATTTTDLGQFQNIKEVRFEAFINVPTANGTVSVRLYNVTDKHPVWNSEVTREGTTATYQFISPAVSYDTSPKLYQVQMKSQLNVVTNLVQSRIHVVAK